MKEYIPFFILLFAKVTILISCSNSENPTSSYNDVNRIIAITNGTLIDGTGSDPIPDALIIIKDRNIMTVGKTSSLDTLAGATLIDVQGSYILPGFINSHVHGVFNEDILKEWAKSGVTTVRDVGTIQAPEEAFSKRNNFLNDNENARLVAAGPIVTTVNGYGMYPVTSPADAEEKINWLIDAGADLIKIAIEDDLQGQTWPMLSLDEIEVICQTAHNKNKRVAAHISRNKHLYLAIKGGVDDVNHMAINEVPDSLISFMIEKDIYWIPTLELWKGVSEMYSINWIDIAKSNLQRFVQAGGKVALGTDYDGYITSFDLGMPITEMKLLQDAGMTSMDIITAGTKHAAYVCDQGNDLGTIKPGKIADLIVVNDNPLDDLEALLNIQIVIKDGKIITNSKR
jgi:imidazolonepropionase-like amidohydrolase